MKTPRALYMENDSTQHTTVVTHIGSGEFNKKSYNWMQLAETIFHPKGGGQPSDEGTISGIKVSFVHKEIPNKERLDQFVIYHCFEQDQPFNFNVGDQVDLLVEASLRFHHSRLHTAGHLLAEAVNTCFPELEAYQGNHYPHNSYVRFRISAPLATENKEEIKQRVELMFNSWIDQNVEVEYDKEPSGLRIVKNFKKWSPCGGTHVKFLKEIGGVEISDLSINKKEGIVTIKYELNETC